MSNSRIARATLIALASVVALTGCMKTDIDLKLQSDDSVDGSPRLPGRDERDLELATIDPPGAMGLD